MSVHVSGSIVSVSRKLAAWNRVHRLERKGKREGKLQQTHFTILRPKQKSFLKTENG